MSASPVISITSLPAELPLRIFVRASEDTEDDKGAKTVFRLTGVCREWRALLLDYPRAWSTVSFAHPDATELMLQRSRTEPIAIHLDLRGRLHPETEHRTSMARHALERAHDRTRRLTVLVDKDPPRNSAKQILSNLSRPAPVLDTVEFLIDNPFGSRATFSIAPHNLAQLSQLKKLSLHDTLLDTVSDSLAGHCALLVHLDLRTVRGLSLPALLAILAAAQKTLETLELDAFELALKPGETPAELIYLPVLRELFLGLDSPFPPKSHVAILEYITYPSTTHLTIHVRVWTDALRALGSQAMLKTYLLARAYQFRSILLDSIPSGLRLRYWLEREPPDLDDLGEHPAALLDLNISYKAASCMHVVTDVLVSLANAANLANVERAVIKPLEERIPWARVLVHTPKLTELSVYGSHNIRNLRFARRALTDSGTGNVYRPTDFALLKAQLLANLATFNVYNLNLISGSESNNGHVELTMLIRCLPRRLDELGVRVCDVRAQDCESLATLVKEANVTWDGIENGLTSAHALVRAVTTGPEVQRQAEPPLSPAEQNTRWRRALQQARAMFTVEGTPSGSPSGAY